MGRQSSQNSTLAALGDAVAHRRIELNLSQEELAAKAGVHRTYVSDVERGIRNISVLTLDRIAGALNIPVSALFALMVVLPNNDDGAPSQKRRRK